MHSAYVRLVCTATRRPRPPNPPPGRRAILLQRDHAHMCAGRRFGLRCRPVHRYNPIRVTPYKGHTRGGWGPCVRLCRWTTGLACSTTLSSAGTTSTLRSTASTSRVRTRTYSHVHTHTHAHTRTHTHTHSPTHTHAHVHTHTHRSTAFAPPPYPPGTSSYRPCGHERPSRHSVQCPGGRFWGLAGLVFASIHRSHGGWNIEVCAVFRGF